MITEGVVLATASVMTEIIIVNKVPIAKRIVTNNQLAGITFSTALSWLMGWIFGATGLTVMLAALGSTCVTWVIYKGMKYFLVPGAKLAIAG